MTSTNLELSQRTNIIDHYGHVQRTRQQSNKWIYVRKICHVVFIPHNLTNKFQTLDITATKSAKCFISNKYNVWFADEITKQLAKSTESADVTKYCYLSLWAQTTKWAVVNIPKLLRIASKLQRLLRLSSLPVYPVHPFRSSTDRKSFHI